MLSGNWFPWILFPLVMITKFIKKGYAHSFHIFYFKWISSFLIVKFIKILILWSLRWDFFGCSLRNDLIFGSRLKAFIVRIKYILEYSHVFKMLSTFFNTCMYSKCFQCLKNFHFYIKTIWTFFFKKDTTLYISIKKTPLGYT